MSDEQQAVIEGYLDELKTELDNCPETVEGAPVGHTPPFTGDLAEIAHCLKTVYDEGKAKRFGGRAFHTHLAQAYGELATMGLSDDPQPVGADEASLDPATIALLLQLLPMVLDLFRKWRS